MDTVLQHVPSQYTEIPDFIWQDVLVNCVKKVERKEEELTLMGLTEFSISGHTEGKKYLPWQMYDKSRFVLSKRR